jgi:hypothetical protein
VVQQVVERAGALRHAWPLVEYSPVNPPVAPPGGSQLRTKPS